MRAVSLEFDGDVLTGPGPAPAGLSGELTSVRIGVPDPCRQVEKCDIDAVGQVRTAVHRDRRGPAGSAAAPPPRTALAEEAPRAHHRGQGSAPLAPGQRSEEHTSELP